MKVSRNFSEVSVRAFLGSAGIRTSKLKTEDDLWSVASVLWPHWINRRPNSDVSVLRGQIAGISRKNRISVARTTLRNVDRRFVSGAEKHQKKIDPAFSERLSAVSEQLRVV